MPMSTHASPSRISRTSYVACPAAWRRSSAMHDSFRNEAYDETAVGYIPRLGRFRSRLCAPRQELASDRLDHARHRDGRKRAEDPRQLGADQDGDEDDERRELHRASVDDGLKDVVLELLVDDEEDDDDHALDPAELHEDDGGDEDRGERGAGERNQVEDADDDGQSDRVVAAEDEEGDSAGCPGDDADGDVARYVAADGAVHLRPDPLPARARFGREEVVEPVDHAGPVEEHEEGQKADGDRTSHRGDHTARDREAGAGHPEHATRALLVDGVLHTLDDLVLRLEEAEGAAAGREVVHDLRHVIDEAPDLLD